MKVTYDPAVDVLRILFSSAAIADSDEQNDIITDYDSAGNVVGWEILRASQRVENPHMVEYTVLVDGLVQPVGDEP